MSERNIVAAVDIGTNTVICHIGQMTSENKIQILGHSIVASAGIRRGVIFNIEETVEAIQKAFENTRLGKGLSFVEIVSNCNSGWKMTPNDANIWMEENMFPYFQLGDIKVDGILKK